MAEIVKRGTMPDCALYDSANRSMPHWISTEGEESLEGEETSQNSLHFCFVRSSSSRMCLEANARKPISIQTRGSSHVTSEKHWPRPDASPLLAELATLKSDSKNRIARNSQI